MGEDMAIVRQVLGGDVDAFRVLVERHQAGVLRFVGNMIADRHACEDVAQEVFVTAFRKLASFDPARSRFRTWLLVVARSRAVNAIKKKAPAAVAALPERTDGREPSDGAMWREVGERLDAALAGLPVRQRLAFVLAEIEELPHAEIAQIEGAKIGTIKSRISRAKAALRQALKDVVGGES